MGYRDGERRTVQEEGRSILAIERDSQEILGVHAPGRHLDIVLRAGPELAPFGRSQEPAVVYLRFGREAYPPENSIGKLKRQGRSLGRPGFEPGSQKKNQGANSQADKMALHRTVSGNRAPFRVDPR